MIDTDLIIPLLFPIDNSVNKTFGEIIFCKDKAQFESIPTIVPSG
jgi:hypothetical protein